MPSSAQCRGVGGSLVAFNNAYHVAVLVNDSVHVLLNELDAVAVELHDVSSFFGLSHD